MITGFRAEGGLGGWPAAPPPPEQEAPSQPPRALPSASPQQAASTSVKTLTHFPLNYSYLRTFLSFSCDPLRAGVLSHSSLISHSPQHRDWPSLHKYLNE